MPHTLEMQIFRFPETTRKPFLKFWFTGNLAFQKFLHHIQKPDSYSLWRNQMCSLSVECKETILCVMFSSVKTIWRGRTSVCSHHPFHPQPTYKVPLWPVLFKSTNSRQESASGLWHVLSLLLYWEAWWERKVISCAYFFEWENAAAGVCCTPAVCSRWRPFSGIPATGNSLVHWLDAVWHYPTAGYRSQAKQRTKVAWVSVAARPISMTNSMQYF